ncbi:MAG: sensor histidine kinase [Limisphaerales bacterium]
MENKRIQVLLIERDVKFTRFLRECLSALTTSEVDVSVGSTLSEALKILGEEQIEAVLLDLCLSEGEGIQTFARVHEQAPDLPIVILTCQENEAFALEALRQGAQDYILKSKLDGKILTRIIRYAIERKRIELKLIAANSELLKSNSDLARSEDALRRALQEIRASHQRLQSTQLQLIQAAKMECVGTLAAGVAHEVKNPLQTILMGLAYLAKNIVVDDDTIGLVLSDMRESVKRADAIVRDLIYLSAAQKIEMKPRDVNGVLEHSLMFVNYDLIRCRVLVKRELARDLPLVRLDEAKMEQVFINLFMNAIQAMPKGGDLFLRTRACRWVGASAGSDPLASKFQAGDVVAVIEIEDTGSGIHDEKLQKVFQPFFTTKPSGLGTGLGLPVSKQILDLHGGSIGLGHGTRGGVRATITLKAEQEQNEKETHPIDR